VRLSIDVDVEKMEKTLKKWCKEAGEDVTVEFLEKMAFIQPTKIDKNNPWWVAFKNECDEMLVLYVYDQ
jgi:aminoacylase